MFFFTIDISIISNQVTEFVKIFKFNAFEIRYSPEMNVLSFGRNDRIIRSKPVKSEIRRKSTDRTTLMRTNNIILFWRLNTLGENRNLYRYFILTPRIRDQFIIYTSNSVMLLCFSVYSSLISYFTVLVLSRVIAEKPFQKLS